MADTKITQLRNLMTPLVNYFTMINNKECSDKAGDYIELDKQQAIYNLPKIREILAEIPDDACSKKVLPHPHEIWRKAAEENAIDFEIWLNQYK